MAFVARPRETRPMVRKTLLLSGPGIPALKGGTLEPQLPLTEPPRNVKAIKMPHPGHGLLNNGNSHDKNKPPAIKQAGLHGRIAPASA